MSGSWKSAPLRDLCEFHNGLWTGKKPPFETAHVIRNTNFTADGRIDLSDVAVLQVEKPQFAKRRLRKGDIIIEKSGGGPKQPVGRVVLFNLDAENFSFSNFTSVIRVKDARILDSIYLHRVLHWWYVSGITEPLQRRSTGIRNLDFDAYKDLEVPLPQLDEQRRIVAALDQAFSVLERACANVDANTKQAAELLDVWIREVFSGSEEWPVRQLADLCENLDRQRVPITKSDRQSGDIPYYGASGVVDYVNDFLFDEDLLLVSEDGANLLARTYPIAFSITGKAWVNNHAHVLRFSDSVSQEFIRLYLNSISLNPYVTGMAQPKLNQSALNAIPVPTPPIQVQAMIVEQAAQIHAGCRRAVSAYEAQAADLTALRQTLLQAAFSGQLN
ncbi:restriction endonuclease subunit S [Luteimonas sp. 3794]|uniref:restriction endonuclease subunit S n=1 Tax=Luteimonas sp. 3794 TaxID=2817730 RepID=UPI002860BCE7|nr:restriction endonuclease subunit S [Luteimonas sp. 3794]MDR6993116.1 type I restriction enzyme S subunit [Luteimonas sp. 3794]